MRQSCRNRVLGLIEQIRKLQVNQKCAEVMLVLDDITTPLLSSIVVQFMALGVKNVTKAQLKKKPFPNYIGIYYISKESLPHLFQDFKKQPIYHSINLLLNEPISHELMQSVADNKNITQRLSYFGELLLNTKYLGNNMGIICKEQNIFEASLRNSYKISPAVMANHILESIISGFEDPSRLIIYHSSSQYIQDITKQLASKYQKYKAQIDTNKNQGKSLRVIVIDRKIDLISPLVRNFYYLNLISDIFNVDFQHREIILRNGSKVTVNFDDAIFIDYKNLHFSKVQGRIEPDLQKFKSENKAAQLRQEGVSLQNKLSNMELKQVIKNIPEYNKKVKSYEEHVNISVDITQISKQQKLPEIGEIEQLIVSGIDGRGEEIKDKRIVERAHQLCIRLTDHQKIVKIMLLMLLCLDVSQSQTKMFINKIKQYPQYAALAEFLQRNLQKVLPKPMKLRLNPQRQRIFLNMHESIVETIVSELIEKGVSKHVSLSVVGDQPKKKVQSKFQAMTKREQKEWLIVMLGGISLNEVVQLQRIQKKYEGNKISIVSTEILTTWSYMDRLATLYEE